MPGDCRLFWYLYESPVGILRITECSSGLHSIFWHTRDAKHGVSWHGTALSGSADAQDPTGLLSYQWLYVYFNNPENIDLVSKPSICSNSTISASSFQRSIWSTLHSNIPFGKTISYSKLASLAGHDGAARAVGSAMKNNPINILVPCHRVTRAGGDPGKYAGGVTIKHWLLAHERK